MAAKLNQYVAIQKDVKAGAARLLADANKTVQKANLFDGQTRVYTPFADDPKPSDLLPEESQITQEALLGDDGLFTKVMESHIRMFDVVLTTDSANTEAKADVVVDGVTIVEGAPVPFLLFMENKLDEYKKWVENCPVLPVSESWTYDEGTLQWSNAPGTKTFRSAKVPMRFERSPATDRHPAQVDLLMEDVNVGTWQTTKLSNRLSRAQQREILSRIERLNEAVVRAREEANSMTVTEREVGAPFFSFLFDNL